MANTKMLNCSRCGTPTKVGDEAKGVVCAACVIKRQQMITSATVVKGSLESSITSTGGSAIKETKPSADVRTEELAGRSTVKREGRLSRKSLVEVGIAEKSTEEVIVANVVREYPEVDKKRIETYVHFLVKQTLGAAEKPAKAEKAPKAGKPAKAEKTPKVKKAKPAAEVPEDTDDPEEPEEE